MYRFNTFNMFVAVFHPAASLTLINDTNNINVIVSGLIGSYLVAPSYSALFLSHFYKTR